MPLTPVSSRASGFSPTSDCVSIISNRRCPPDAARAYEFTIIPDIRTGIARICI